MLQESNANNLVIGMLSNSIYGVCKTPLRGSMGDLEII